MKTDEHSSFKAAFASKNTSVRCPDPHAFQHQLILLVLGGVLVLFGVLWLSLRADIHNASGLLDERLDYLKNQCALYTRVNETSINKSLMRIRENAQISARYEYDQTLNDPEVLASRCKEMRLTGLLVLNPDGSLQQEYTTDEIGYQDLQDFLSRQAILEIAHRPRQTYAARVDLPDGSYVDLSAVGRNQEPGVVVALYHTSSAFAHRYDLTLQTLLDGFTTSRSSTVAVMQNNQVVASTDAELVGLPAADSPILAAMIGSSEDGELAQTPVRVHTSDGVYYGGITKSRDYYIYAFLPSREVFHITPRNLLIAVVFYIILCIIYQLLRSRSRSRYEVAQAKQEAAYREELKAAAAKAESASRAKTEFLQRMSHDIRTPINGIRGMVEMGNYYADDPAKQADCRKKIWEASGYLLELVNEVLDMGKLESGEIVLEERPFDLHELLQNVQIVTEKQAAARDVQIMVRSFAIQHWALIGSPLHLKRLMMNVLSNTIKYNHEKGFVYVSGREVDAQDGTATIELVCQDTGIGMSKEFQQHVFEPFSQEGGSARTRFGGTGLGLSIAKSLAEAMGGSLTFRSELGVGTTFIATLPFRIDPESHTAPAANTSKTDGLHGLHILVAEDNDLNLDIATFVLETAGATVSTARNGQEAADAFAASAPGTLDAILMDVMMPVMDGHEATRRIRQLHRPDAQTIPIIAMTANAFVEDRQKALEAGMNEHLTKPLDSAKVVETIRNLVQK